MANNPPLTWDDVIKIVLDALRHYQILNDPADTSSLLTCFADANKADTASPPNMGPRVDRFIDTLNKKLGYPVDLLAHELIAGSYYPRIHDLVDFLYDQQP